MSYRQTYGLTVTVMASATPAMHFIFFKVQLRWFYWVTLKYAEIIVELK